MLSLMIESNTEELYNQAKQSFHDRKYSEAIILLRGLLRSSAYRARALASIGASLFHLRHYKAAQKYLIRALAIESDLEHAQFNLANTLLVLGEHEEALSIFSHITTANPENDEAWRRSFDVLLFQDNTSCCQDHVDNWSRHLPASQNLAISQARLLRKQGRQTEAICVLRSALFACPSSSRLYALMGEILLELKRLDDALPYIDKAIELDPLDIGYYCIKANIHYFMSQVNECSASYSKALILSPKSAVLYLNAHLLFPIVPASSSEIQACRDQFVTGLTVAESSLDLELVLEHPIALHTFPLAYHNKNDRPLLERYANLMKQLAKPLLLQLGMPAKLELPTDLISDDNKIRIGFLSRFFCGHSNTLAFEGLIRHLNRLKFKVVLIHAPGSTIDNVQIELNSCCDEVIYLSNNFSEVYRTLHGLCLDILYFTDMGMCSYDFLLPFMRSCKIQLTGWGIPHTSGNPDIDYYISADGIEPESPDDHYTEKLIRLPGGLPCCFLVDDLEVASFTREYFFLPSHCQLIGCLQSLHKLHPDFDLVLEDIAKNNPESIFVFVEDSIGQSTERFITRLSNNAPNVREQSLFLKVMGRGEYQALCKCMDILLDPIYYGSGITFFEAALAGTPIVTLDGDFLRSRVVASGYREIELENAPISSTVAEYVSITTELLRNDSRRNALKSSLKRRRHRLFNRFDFVRSFESFCMRAVNSHRVLNTDHMPDSEHSLTDRLEA